jgi:hypothetical protein
MQMRMRLGIAVVVAVRRADAARRVSACCVGARARVIRARMESSTPPGSAAVGGIRRVECVERVTVSRVGAMARRGRARSQRSIRPGCAVV